LPMWFIHRQIASTINIVVQVARLSGGARKIVQISEITGVFGETLNMHDIFSFNQEGVDEQGHAQGRFASRGIVPNCMARFHAAGITMPLNIFEPHEFTFERVDAVRGM